MFETVVWCCAERVVRTDRDCAYVAVTTRRCTDDTRPA